MTSYHMIFKNGYSGSLNKCGGLPTHLPEVWPQIDGTDLSFLFQLYCDEEKLNIPNTLCIQGYQLFEEGDYNSDIVVIQLPPNAKENIQQIGLSCPISPDYAGGDIEFEIVEETNIFEENEKNGIDVFASKLLGWHSENDLAEGNAFLGWLRDESPFVIGANCHCCLLVNAKGEVVTKFL